MRDILKKLLWSIPFTSASVSLILAYSRWKANIPQEAQLGFIFVTLFATAAFVLLLGQEYRYARKARYAETTSNLLNVVTLRERDLPATSGHCCEVLNKMVGEVAETFTLLTGTRASACLKQVVMVG